MRHTGIIIAKGNSRRFPQKNIMPFCGRSLVAWKIIQLRAIPDIDKVYLTTDDSVIAGIGEEYGATIHMREDPFESLATTPGNVPTMAVIKKYHLEDDVIFSGLPTSVLIQPHDYERLLKVFYALDMKMPVGSVAKLHEVLLARPMTENICRPFFGFFQGVEPWPFLDLNPQYLSVALGQIYINRCSIKTRENDDIKKEPSGEMHWDHTPEITDELESGYITLKPWQQYDIDDPADAEIGEYFFEKKGLKDYWNQKWEQMR